MDEMLFAACRYLWSYISRIPEYIAATIGWCCKAIWFCFECCLQLLVSGGEVFIEIIGAILGALVEGIGSLFD